MKFLKFTLVLILLLSSPTWVLADNPAAAPQTPLSVEALMKAPDKHPGVIEVKGAVSSVSAKKGTLTLIDVGELEECGVANCAEYVLPVQWKGPFPAVKEIVLIKGKVEKVVGKKVFVAISLKKLDFKTKAKANRDDDKD